MNTNILKNNEKHINVLVSLGTRPEGIKLAPIIKVLARNQELFRLTVCSTGQHKEMLDQVLNFFEIKPDILLDIMTDNQSLGSLSAGILQKIEKVLERVSTDILIVQGDTTTAFLTALSAYYKKIKICHIEAGLRTYNKLNPFPEEINRQFISRIADFNFAPTERSKDNLIKEGINPDTIFMTGNTIVDALEWGIEKIKRRYVEIEKKDIFKRISGSVGEKIILVTMHRRESFGEEIINVCTALKEVAEENKSVKIVYPVHLNPNVKKPVFDLLSGINNIILMEPLSYEDFLWLMHRAYLIITDSGGVQEEAPTLKKPVLVIRNFTERPESVEKGISKLIGTETEAIIRELSLLLNDNDEYKKMIAVSNPYGDGRASERIISMIANKYNRSNSISKLIL
jgi:UDP-N-acetylglucosamine 2-epimerase (non-hydrolysing)